MKPFQIKRKNENLEVMAKITDSVVQAYGCRVKYNRETGHLYMIGDSYCKEIVSEVVTDMFGHG